MLSFQNFVISFFPFCETSTKFSHIFCIHALQRHFQNAIFSFLINHIRIKKHFQSNLKDIIWDFTDALKFYTFRQLKENRSKTCNFRSWNRNFFMKSCKIIFLLIINLCEYFSTLPVKGATLSVPLSTSFVKLFYFHDKLQKVLG